MWHSLHEASRSERRIWSGRTTGRPASLSRSFSTWKLPAPWQASHCTPSVGSNVSIVHLGPSSAAVPWQPRQIRFSAGAPGKPERAAMCFAVGLVRAANVVSCVGISSNVQTPLACPSTWHSRHTDRPTYLGKSDSCKSWGLVVCASNPVPASTSMWAMIMIEFPLNPPRLSLPRRIYWSIVNTWAGLRNAAG